MPSDPALAAILQRAEETTRVVVEPGDTRSMEAWTQRVIDVVGDARDLAWGTMTYGCTRCGFEHSVTLGVGVEGPPELRDQGVYVPAPMMCGRCPRCDEHLGHIRWSEDEAWPELRPTGDGPRFLIPAKADGGDHDYYGADYRGHPDTELVEDGVPYARCMRCGQEVTRREIIGLSRCPRCKTKTTPVEIEHDVTISINWQELRILGMWAERFAELNKDRDASMQRLVNVICGRIHAQHPDRSALTMTGELGAITRLDGVTGPVEVTGFSPDTEAEPDLEDSDG